MGGKACGFPHHRLRRPTDMILINVFATALGLYRLSRNLTPSKPNLIAPNRSLLLVDAP